MGLNYIIQGIMYLEKLIELVPAPANPVGNDDSSIVYKKLGIYLPEDYFRAPPHKSHRLENVNE